MESIKLNGTKELRMSWQVRLHLHTCRSCSMVHVHCRSLSFIVHYQDFNKFVVALQSTEPIIQLLYTKYVKLVKDLLSRFVKNDSFVKQANLLSKEEIIQVINQEEECKVYHSYFNILDTLFILYIHQYLLLFNFWKPVPKFLIRPFCSYNIWSKLTYSLVRSSKNFPFFCLFNMER